MAFEPIIPNSNLATNANFLNSANSSTTKERSEGLSVNGVNPDSSDQVTFSQKAIGLAQNDKQNNSADSKEQQSNQNGENSQEENKAKLDGSDQPKNQFNTNELSDEEQREIEDLKRRDQEVRAHEQAHLASAGDLALSGANFKYEVGPDGKRYAVSGEVSIDVSAVPGDPEATIQKAQKIRRAANAPADPSPQDRSVAAEASRMEARARAELLEQERQEREAKIREDAPEIDFFAPIIEQNEKNIQDTYKKIQNTSVLADQRIVVDVFI